MKGNFVSPIRIEALDGGRTFKLLEPLKFQIAGQQCPMVTVPQGFVTDFASIPRIFWGFISPLDRTQAAAILHDYLYRIRWSNNRRLCDIVFLAAMEAGNVPGWKGNLIYRAVRMGGWWAWRKHGKMFPRD